MKHFFVLILLLQIADYINNCRHTHFREIDIWKVTFAYGSFPENIEQKIAYFRAYFIKHCTTGNRNAGP